MLFDFTKGELSVNDMAEPPVNRAHTACMILPVSSKVYKLSKCASYFTALGDLTNFTPPLSIMSHPCKPDDSSKHAHNDAS